MALSNIRDEIKTLIAGATGVQTANVHTYERLVETDDVFLSLYEDQTLPGIHGWAITRNGTNEVMNGMSLTLTIHNMILKGWYRLNDAEASEKDFEAIVEAVLAQLRTQINTDPNNILGGYAFNVLPPQVQIAELRTIFNTLCHYVEIRFPVLTRNSL